MLRKLHVICGKLLFQVPVYLFTLFMVFFTVQPLFFFYVANFINVFLYGFGLFYVKKFLKLNRLYSFLKNTYQCY